MCDARYCLTVIDIGAAGRESDGGVFARSTFGQMFIADELDMPHNGKLPGTLEDMPFVCLADAAFPLRSNLMKPYGGKNLTMEQMIFNYRLSRARRVIENTFGILAARWRILRRQINAEPSRVETFMKAICVLHNYLQKPEIAKQVENSIYCPPGFVDSFTADGSVIPGMWRSEDQTSFLNSSYCDTPSNRYAKSAATLRDNFAKYFVSDSGAVKWQNRLVFGSE